MFTFAYSVAVNFLLEVELVFFIYQIACYHYRLKTEAKFYKEKYMEMWGFQEKRKQDEPIKIVYSKN